MKKYPKIPSSIKVMTIDEVMAWKASETHTTLQHGTIGINRHGVQKILGVSHSKMYAAINYFNDKFPKVIGKKGENEYIYDLSDIVAFSNLAGSRYFCESFYGHPCPTSGKNYATANACGCPSRPASLVGYPTRGIQHHSRNDSTRCRKACIFTPQKTLRENTCPIASGDYSTPVSQRTMSKK